MPWNGFAFIRKSQDLFSNTNLFFNVITLNCQFHYDKWFYSINIRCRSLNELQITSLRGWQHKIGMSFACYLQIVKVPPKLLARTREGSGVTLRKPNLFNGIGCTHLLCSCTLTVQLVLIVALERYFSKIRYQIQHSKSQDGTPKFTDRNSASSSIVLCLEFSFWTRKWLSLEYLKNSKNKLKLSSS